MTSDIAIVFTAHTETLAAGRTLRSLNAAIQNAEGAGISVERVIVLDKPTPEAISYFEVNAGEGWKRKEVSFADPGLTRNAGINMADAKYIAIADSDDLVSENWLVRSFETAEKEQANGQAVVVHPELLWRFDLEIGAKVNLPSDHPFQDSRSLLISNPYDAMCFAPRSLFIEKPFKPRLINEGYAFEDWCWIAETWIAGVQHKIAKDTIIFKRRRVGSINKDARGRGSLLPALDGFRLSDFDIGS